MALFTNEGKFQRDEDGRREAALELNLDWGEKGWEEGEGAATSGGSNSKHGSFSDDHGSKDLEKASPSPQPQPLPPSRKAGPPTPFALAVAQSTFPEGGRDAWLTVVGSCLAVMLSFGLITSFGVFQSHYSLVLVQSNSSISWIGSLQTGFFYIVGAGIGRVFDAFGPKWLTLAGTLLLSFGLMMTSLGSQYWQLLLSQGVVVGLGAALLFYPSLLSVPSYFLRLRGLAVGIVAAGAALGGVVWPIALQKMFLRPELGFAWTIRILGFVSLVLGLVATSLVKSRAPPRKSGAWFEWVAWKDPRYSATVVGAALSTLGFFVPYFYLDSYAIMRGVPSSVSFYSLTAVNGGSLLGRLLTSLFCDRFGKYNTLLVSSLLSSVICLAFWLPLGLLPDGSNQVLAAIMCFGLIFGLANGAFFSASLPALASITPLTHLGTRAGMLYTLLTIPSLIGTPISGAFLSKEDLGHFDHLIIWSGVTQLCGFVAFALARIKISSRLFHAV
ncbi:MFS general substrate transporter [Violaceomyces palustris]|uniref:MFS general substrate transporter n=1 Tax=Violaceomyces palustris TaxID=1673888 RepID=A0ACD0NPC6_9BASI|nr:MFS general substrate transporter [Violaceomyces palustris]